MRIILILLLLPFVTKAQLNRSATALAHENISEYIHTKIFKRAAYKPVFYGALIPIKEADPNVRWRIEHRFEIAPTQTNPDTTVAAELQLHNFIFYLDKRLEVVKAEAFHF